VAEVSRASYYKWQKRKRIFLPRDIENEKLKNLIISAHMVKRSMGYRRIANYIFIKTGWKVSGIRVLKLMQELHIQAIFRKKKRKNHGADHLTIPNILNRNFKSSRPLEKVATDITFIKKPGLYLSVFLDLYNNEVLEYEISKYYDMQLVMNPLRRLLSKRKNDVLKAHPVFHSDQGYQYTSKSYNLHLQQYGICQSMSRQGTPHDNAPCECFIGLFKDELAADYDPKTTEDYISAIHEQITYHNYERPQSRLDYISPIAFRLG
jgi:transposase InsO family protein